MSIFILPISFKSDKPFSIESLSMNCIFLALLKFPVNRPILLSISFISLFKLLVVLAIPLVASDTKSLLVLSTAIDNLLAVSPTVLSKPLATLSVVEPNILLTSILVLPISLAIFCISCKALVVFFIFPAPLT